MHPRKSEAGEYILILIFQKYIWIHHISHELDTEGLPIVEHFLSFNKLNENSCY